jgi:hypothetical protein
MASPARRALARGVVEYIAREAVRRYGPIEPRLPEKLQRNIRRNFKTTAGREEILRLAGHYKGAYAYASGILPRFLNSPKGKYVDPADVSMAAFMAAVRKRYPRESKAVLDIIIWYTVYYEYLS